MMAGSAQSILYAIQAFPAIDFHDAAENPINGISASLRAVRCCG